MLRQETTLLENFFLCGATRFENQRIQQWPLLAALAPGQKQIHNNNESAEKEEESPEEEEEDEEDDDGGFFATQPPAAPYSIIVSQTSTVRGSSRAVQRAHPLWAARMALAEATEKRVKQIRALLLPFSKFAEIVRLSMRELLGLAPSELLGTPRFVELLRVAL